VSSKKMKLCSCHRCEAEVNSEHQQNSREDKKLATEIGKQRGANDSTVLSFFKLNDECCGTRIRAIQRDGDVMHRRTCSRMSC